MKFLSIARRLIVSLIAALLFIPMIVAAFVVAVAFTLWHFDADEGFSACESFITLCTNTARSLAGI